jgi:hypothetical protein
MMTADWTDQDTFVIWDIALTAGSRHSVKILYALRDFLRQPLRRWQNSWERCGTSAVGNLGHGGYDSGSSVSPACAAG